MCAPRFRQGFTTSCFPHTGTGICMHACLHPHARMDKRTPVHASARAHARIHAHTHIPHRPSDGAGSAFIVPPCIARFEAAASLSSSPQPPAVELLEPRPWAQVHATHTFLHARAPACMSIGTHQSSCDVCRWCAHSQSGCVRGCGRGLRTTRQCTCSWMIEARHLPDTCRTPSRHVWCCASVARAVHACVCAPRPRQSRAGGRACGNVYMRLFLWFVHCE